MTAAPTPIKWALTAQKRAVKAPTGMPKNKDGNLANWTKDEEGFQSRWPDSRRPNNERTSTNPAPLIEEANRLNEQQLRSGFLDWLFVVDVAMPVHPCNDGEDCDRYFANWVENRGESK